MEKKIIIVAKDEKEDDKPRKGGALPPYGFNNKVA